MPLFKCPKCGCLENTAVGAYWWRVAHDEEPECSECHTGKWHGHFEKTTPEERGYVELEDGFWGPADGSWGPVKEDSCEPEDKNTVMVVGGMGSGNSALTQAIMNLSYNDFLFTNPYEDIEESIPEKATRITRLKRCALPDCQNTTNHQGGYCCADHCREHRRMQGKKIKAIGR